MVSLLGPRVAFGAAAAFLASGCFNPDDSTAGTETDATATTPTTTQPTDMSMSPTAPTITNASSDTIEPDTTATLTDPATSSDSSTGDPGPDCGNGEMNPGEECDDGDQESGDGCSAACLDETDFCEPALIGATNASDLGRMVVEDEYLYSIRYDAVPSGMRVFDISEPTAPASVGSLFALDPDDYPNWRTFGLAKHGDHLWSAGDNPEFFSIDVSDPTSPVVDYLSGPNTIDGHLAIVGNNLFLARSVAETGYIYNVSDPSTAVFVDTYGNPNEVFTNVEAHATWAFAITSVGHLEVWDVTVIGAPVFTGQVDANPPMSGIARIEADDDTIVLATDDGVHFVDYNLPSVPDFAGSFGTGTVFTDVALRGDYVYVPTPTGAQAWDILSVDDPELAYNFLEVGANSISIAYDDTYVYVGTATGLRVLEELPGFCEARCGNNTIEHPEDCDDGNLEDGDDCPANCEDSDG